jgi:hypothetical protein
VDDVAGEAVGPQPSLEGRGQRDVVLDDELPDDGTSVGTS